MSIIFFCEAAPLFPFISTHLQMFTSINPVFPFLSSPFLKQVPLFLNKTWTSRRWIGHLWIFKAEVFAKHSFQSTGYCNKHCLVIKYTTSCEGKSPSLPLFIFLSFTLSHWAWRAPWFTRFAGMGAYLSVKGGLFLWATIEKCISEEMEVIAARLENTR